MRTAALIGRFHCRRAIWPTSADQPCQGLGGHFDADLQSLRGTFERELNAEQRLARDWAAEAADLLQPVRCQTVLAHLHQAGWLNKSGYAELCGLSPATASMAWRTSSCQSDSSNSRPIRSASSVNGGSRA